MLSFKTLKWQFAEFFALLLLLSPANAAKMFPHLHAITLVDSLKMIALLAPISDTSNLVVHPKLVA